MEGHEMALKVIMDDNTSLNQRNSLYFYQQPQPYNDTLTMDEAMLKDATENKQNLSSSSSDVMMMSQHPGLLFYVLCTIYLGLVSVIGLSLNLTYVVIFARCRQLQTGMGVLYLNLCVADLMISFSSIVKTVYIGLDMTMVEGQPICYFFGFTTFIGGMQSIFTLTVVAGYRYAVTVGKMQTKSIRWPCLLLILIGLWVVGLLLALGPLIGWNSYYPDGDSGHWCALNWWDRSLSGKCFLSVVFSVVFLLPVSIMTFCYCAIWCKLRKLSKKFQHSQSKKAEHSLVKSSCIMATCFVMAWGPYAILAFSAFLELPIRKLPYFVVIFPFMMCKLTPCINPTVYFRADPVVRKVLQRLHEHLVRSRQMITNPKESASIMHNPSPYQMQDQGLSANVVEEMDTSANQAQELNPPANELQEEANQVQEEANQTVEKSVEVTLLSKREKEAYSP